MSDIAGLLNLISEGTDNEEITWHFVASLVALPGLALTRVMAAHTPPGPPEGNVAAAAALWREVALWMELEGVTF